MLTLYLALLLPLAPAAEAADKPAPDTLVVCPAPLVDAMRPWFAHRAAQGRRVVLLRDADSAERIAAAVRHVAKGGKLTHVLIVGDDHPARKSDEALRARTVPARRVEAKVNIRWGSEPQIATDNPYADIDGDHIPDVAIGRLTADTPEQLAVIVKKIIAYETSRDHSPWRRRVNFIAGVGGFGPVADTILDMATKRFITGGIPSGYRTSMTYASISSPYCPDPRRLPETAVARHNEGCLFWVYIGHGQRRWLDSMRLQEHAFPILSADHVEQMEARSGLPIAVFLACYTGAFDEREDCMSEEMLVQPSGPVAVISGTRVTMPYANAVLGHALLQQCFAHDHETLGELVLHAKQSAAKGDARGGNRQLLDALAAAISPNKEELDTERIEHLHMYNLLGDPLLRLRRPQEVNVKAPATADAGEEIEIVGECAIAGRCTVELVCRRDKLTFKPPSRRGFEISNQSLVELSDVYARANNQRWTAKALDISPGRFRTTLRVPRTCSGHCHVRIYVEGPAHFALGAADVFVHAPPSAEDDRDPFAE